MLCLSIIFHRVQTAFIYSRSFPTRLLLRPTCRLQCIDQKRKITTLKADYWGNKQSEHNLIPCFRYHGTTSPRQTPNHTPHPHPPVRHGDLFPRLIFLHPTRWRPKITIPRPSPSSFQQQCFLMLGNSPSRPLPRPSKPPRQIRPGDHHRGGPMPVGDQKVPGGTKSPSPKSTGGVKTGTRLLSAWSWWMGL